MITTANEQGTQINYQNGNAENVILMQFEDN
jgi:hypothetical protein